MSGYILFRFPILSGGIGDMIKYFVCALDISKQYNMNMCIIEDENILSKYIILNDKEMYKSSSFFKDFKHIYSVSSISSIKTDIETNKKHNEDFVLQLVPSLFYDEPVYDILKKYNLSDIFYFSNEVVNLSKQISSTKDYVSIHIRRGDKFIETSSSFKAVPHDERPFNEDKLSSIIEETHKENKDILFFCDSMVFKKKIQKQYPFLTMTDFKIGHTSYTNTSDEQVLNTVCEFYLLSQSTKIIANCKSGFSTVATGFNNIPIIYYETDLVPNRY
jgi:hypothetical protein